MSGPEEQLLNTETVRQKMIELLPRSFSERANLKRTAGANFWASRAVASGREGGELFLREIANFSFSFPVAINTVFGGAMQFSAKRASPVAPLCLGNHFREAPNPTDLITVGTNSGSSWTSPPMGTRFQPSVCVF